jgi:beta-glucosidase
MEAAYPAMDTIADRKLADLHHATFNLWFLDPLMGKGYPQNVWAYYGSDVPEIQAGDMEIIQAPLDFLGLNYYTRRVVHDPAGGEGKVLHQRDDHNVSERDWEIYPAGLYDLLTWLHQDYPQIPEFYVSENGISCPDVLENGCVHDPQRIDFFKQHFEAAARAIEAGVPLKGYFAWSLLDNFEWAFGYSSRFGLVYIDFDTQKRILKDSGHWYGRVAAANAIVE